MLDYHAKRYRNDLLVKEKDGVGVCEKKENEAESYQVCPQASI